MKDDSPRNPDSVTPELAMLLWTCGRLRSEWVPDYASQWLEDGVEAPGIIQLSILENPSWSDAEKPFLQGLKELEVEVLPHAIAAHRLACHYAGEIVAGRLRPYEGARDIWTLCIDLDYPDDLTGFIGVASERENFVAERVSNPDKFDRLIKECDDDIISMSRKLMKSVAA